MSRKHKGVQLIGMANIKHSFVTLVGLTNNLKHNGASFSTILTDLLCL